MTLAQWPSIPDEFYYDHTENHDRDGPDYSLPASKWMSRPAINVKHEILQALYSGLSGERAYALYLGETFEMLIEDHGLHVKPVTSTAYQRFLVYCCSVYYKLAFGVDHYTLEIFIVRTPASRIPPLRIAEMVPTPPELSVANLRFANLQLRRSKRTTPISTPTAQKIDPDKQEILIAEREAEYDAAVARIFVEEEPEKPRNDSDSDAHPATDPLVRILSRSTTTPRPSQTGSFPQDEGDAMESNTGILKQPPTKHTTMTLAEREEAYREARRRIFLGFEEAPTKDETNNDGSSDSHSSEEVDDVLDFKESAPTFSRTTPVAKDAIILIPAPTNRQPNPTVRFRLPPAEPELATPPWTYPNGGPPGVSHEYEEGPENSETAASMSGGGSVYSHASSRTKSTDYGLYYTRRALSQESLPEIFSGSILRPLYKQ